MNWIREFWADESGLVLSAEAVTVGTVGVLGTLVGLNAATSALNDEMKEFAGAIRSLDQSYAYAGHRGCGAWTAGSCFIQQDVQQSLADLWADGDVKTIQQQVEADRQLHLKSSVPQQRVEPTPTPLPNNLPEKKAEPAPDKPAA